MRPLVRFFDGTGVIEVVGVGSTDGGWECRKEGNEDGLQRPPFFHHRCIRRRSLWLKTRLGSSQSRSEIG